VSADKLFGKRIKRREDPKFITGRGTYVDDLKLPFTAHAAFVRSPHASAKIGKIDTAAARAIKGVVAIYTGKDLIDGGLQPIPTGWLIPGIKVPARHSLATDRARYTGDAVAVVIAETPYAARDAAELVKVDYEPLPAVSDCAEALEPGAPQVHDEIAGNSCFKWTIGDEAATAKAFSAAAKIVKQSFRNHRLIPNAIEPRACLANCNQGTGDVTLWITTQNPQVHRLIMSAFVLSTPEHKLRVVSPDVGGGFGSKIFVYPEECAVVWAARKLFRPVKWTSDRREAFLTDAHGRDHHSEAELALSAEGKVLGLRVKTVANMGACLSLFAPAIPTYLYGTLLSGTYEIPAIHCAVSGAFTNTTPVDAYRGEDVLAIRQRNFIPKEKFPYQTPVAVLYDSGDYQASLDKALTLFDYQAFRKEQEAARKRGRYLGVGFSTYVEACGLAPSQAGGALGAQAGLYESATVRVHPTGKVTVFTGSHSHGQGHETTFAQVAADELQLPIEDIEIVHGDSGRAPAGTGTYGSRRGAVGTAAIYLGAQKIKEKAKKIAAHLLEVNEGDVLYESGRFSVKGEPARFKTFADISLMAYLAHNMPKNLEPGLEAISFFDPGNFVFPFGTHVCVVEVERETGLVKILRYLACDDLGRVINPMVVDGMVHGGIAQGVSQALWEHAEYDQDAQLITGSLMSYAMPHAGDLPTSRWRARDAVAGQSAGSQRRGRDGNRCFDARRGQRGHGRAPSLGILHLDMTLTPGRIWEALRGKEA
jgi:aerobic carbon-monoxide dehydrogenase large subunit